MAPKIRVLDEHTINKIAAGEVIENPSSVVKELVENSLDAGATDISVEIKGGGRSFIRITDNGCGMNGDDALLCLERHATSKIHAVEDIHEIHTMGFRGEAVPSIAAISKFTILTRQRENKTGEGTLVIVEGGKILKCTPAACSLGTSIEVKSLFFNIPVRKKFQKSPAHDANEILKIITLLALGHPNIKFKLTVDGGTVLKAPAPHSHIFLEQMKERIGSVLGGEYIEHCLPLETCKDGYELKGWIGSPSQHRQNRTGQHLFINCRGVQSPLVSFAMKDGYGTTLPSQRHPQYVLHLTLPGSLVDVNVHPQKKEVRLRQESILRELIVEAVQASIQQSDFNDHFEAPRAILPINGSFELDVMPQTFSQPIYRPPVVNLASVRPAFAEYKEVLQPMQVLTKETPKADPASKLEFALPIEMPKRNLPKVTATMPRYLILDHQPEDCPNKKQGLCLADQKAAHARIIFEHLNRSGRNGYLEVQSLLIPLMIELSPVEAGVLKRHLEDLENYGIHLKEFGRYTFMMDALPKVMGNLDPKEFIQEIVSRLSESESSLSIREEMQRRLAQAAIRSSVSKDRTLSIAEGQSLIDQLLQCEIPWYCPQGKQTIISIPFDEIHKHFL